MLFIFVENTIVLFALCSLEFLRIHLGRKGSLSDHGYQVWLSVILIIPVAFGVIYLLFLQEYVLKLEYILCALMLLLHMTELGAVGKEIYIFDEETLHT